MLPIQNLEELLMMMPSAALSAFLQQKMMPP
jgi:hypothetical protein